MPDLKSRFDGVDHIPSPDLWPEILERGSRPMPSPVGSWRRVGTVAVAFALAAAGMAFAVWAFVGEPSPGRTSKPLLGSPSEGQGPSSVRPTVAETIPLEGVSGVAYGAGVLWATVWEPGSAPSLLRLHPETGEVMGEVRLEAVTSWEVYGQGMAVTPDAIWVIGDSEGRVLLQRVDPVSNRVTDLFDLGPGFAADVAADEVGVWVTVLRGDDFSSPAVLRVESSSGEVVATIPLSQEWARDVVLAGGYVFVHQQDVRGSGGHRESSLVRIDPTTNAIVDELPGGEWIIEVPLLWEGRIWMTQGYALSRVDPSTNSYVSDPIDVDRVPLLFAAGAGGLWFSADADSGLVVQRLNTITGEVDASVRLPGSANPVDMVVADGSIWIVDYGGFLTRIDLG